MIKSFSATTREIDDPQVAVAEVLAALDLDNNLLKNSLAIVFCYPDFEETGVLKAVCDALPFDSIGSTTCLCATGDDCDQLMLLVTVLTSDDCDFKTSLIPIDEKYEQSIEFSLSELLSRPGDKPSLFLGYLPLIYRISGDMILAAIDRATCSIPFFGMLATDNTPDFTDSKTIYNGEAFREAVALGALCGNVKFSFKVASIDEKKARKQKAIITKSDGAILIGVNGKPALEYLEEIGMKKNELVTGIIPIIVDHGDGTKPIIRDIYAITPEGYAICGGTMPEGATLSIGRLDVEDVLSTTEEIMKTFAERDCTILSYSCVARYYMLGANIKAEADKVKEASIEAKYQFVYSGGEICPLVDADGKLKNYSHSYTNVFCKLS